MAEPPAEGESGVAPVAQDVGPVPQGPAPPQKPMHLHVTVVTGDRAVYDGLADCVVAPALEGQISVLLHHASLIAALEPGGLLVRLGPAEQSFAVGGGFIEVRDDEVIILADTAERAEEIDIARAEAARRRARALVKMYRDRPESAAAWQALRRSRVRIQVAQRIKK